MSRLEKAEELEVKKWCKENRILAIKFTPMGERGWPDRVFVFPTGVHVWIEFKRKGKKPTKLQYYRMGLLTEQGALVTWTDNAAYAIEYLQEVLDAVEPPLISTTRH